MANNECTWVVTATTEITSVISVQFRVPIMGYVALWLAEAASIDRSSENREVKEYWHVPVSGLLEIAKV